MNQDAYDELSDYIAADEVIRQRPTEEDWSTLTLADADWHARSARKRQRRIDEAHATADIMRARIDEWIERTTKLDTERLARHHRALEAYHRRRIDADPNERTVELPTGGRLRSQAGKLSVAIIDEAAALEWANAELPDAVVTTSKLDKTVLAKAGGSKADAEPGEYPAVTDDGEVIPGVAIVRGDRRFYVDLPDDPAADR